MHYYIIKDAVYDFMFFISFLIVFYVSEKALKAFASFGVIISGGSAVDKIIFSLNQYLYSDILLIIIGIIVSISVYRKEKWKTQKHG